MNRNFNPFISKRVSDTINFKAAEISKKKISTNLQQSVQCIALLQVYFWEHILELIGKWKPFIATQLS